MHREQSYKTWEDVKTELAESIKNLAPAGLKDQVSPQRKNVAEEQIGSRSKKWFKFHKKISLHLINRSRTYHSAPMLANAKSSSKATRPYPAIILSKK
jgi:hypothetical protein